MPSSTRKANFGAFIGIFLISITISAAIQSQSGASNEIFDLEVIDFHQTSNRMTRFVYTGSLVFNSSFEIRVDNTLATIELFETSMLLNVKNIQSVKIALVASNGGNASISIRAAGDEYLLSWLELEENRTLDITQYSDLIISNGLMNFSARINAGIYIRVLSCICIIEYDSAYILQDVELDVVMDIEDHSIINRTVVFSKLMNSITIFSLPEKLSIATASYSNIISFSISKDSYLLTK